jgi:hypothetical protein
VAVVLTAVQTKQIRINVHKRNNTKTQYKQYKTINASTHITKQVKTTTVKEIKTTTVQDINNRSTRYKQPQYKI